MYFGRLPWSANLMSCGIGEGGKLPVLGKAGNVCIISLAGRHRRGNWVDKVGSSDYGLLSWSESAVNGDQSIVEFVASRKPGISGLQGHMVIPHLMFCSTCTGSNE